MTSTENITEAFVSLMPTFEAQAGAAGHSERVFVYPESMAAHNSGMEATVLQLQSPCYEPIDFYMIGGTLPVAEKSWGTLMAALGSFGEAKAWDAARQQCTASVTVDRVPIDLAETADEMSVPTWRAKAAFTVMAAALIGTAATMLAAGAKGVCHPAGVGSWFKMDLGSRIVTVLHAGVVAALACGLAFGLGWLMLCVGGRSTERMIMLHFPHAKALLMIEPMLSKMCLPVAGALLGATFIGWLWPNEAEQPPSGAAYVRKQVDPFYSPLVSGGSQSAAGSLVF